MTGTDAGTGEWVAVDSDSVWPADASPDAEEGFVVDWFVREGASVEAGDTLCAIQVEKVDTDVLAPVSGTLVERSIGEDESFDRGDVLGYVDPG